MAAVITQEKLDKAVEKAVKAETKRCIAAVKDALAYDATVDSKDFVRGAKAAQKEAVAAIKAE